MRYFILLFVVFLQACSTVDIVFKDPNYRIGDVRTKYGEKHVQLPNWENEAIIRNRLCRQGIDTANNCY